MNKIAVKDFLPIVLPEGTYQATVVAAEERYSRDGESSYVNVTLDVGASKKKVYDRFLITHPNASAAAIGIARLCWLASAAGLDFIEDPEVLIGEKVSVEIGIIDDPERGKQNQVKKYLPPTMVSASDDEEEDENITF